ncbi:MAG: Alcohol dehydrogenase cytochrome c subunit precursor [candidate division BRC1 bacterium ADurb.BinA364]|nr:MAG: Alcohol dehydrogenase cytochrome c subunit precursor [candidate division BRC1 bacterium ADurb.BinA364]
MKHIAVWFSALAIWGLGCGGADSNAPKADAGAASAPAQTASAAVPADGEALYKKNCLICHQADGGGVPDFQPSLIGAPLVIGEPEPLIRFVMFGEWPPDLERLEGYGNTMAQYQHMKNQELAAVLTYIRQSFGNQASAIGPEEIMAARGSQ